VNRRTYTLVLMWLLPLLLARALIPSGFMLGAGTDGFGLIFCSGTMSMPMSEAGARHQHPAGHVDHSMHMAHAAHASSMDDAGHDGTHGENESAACPFAIGACAASIDIPHLAAVMAAPAGELVRLVILAGSSIVSLRAHPIRGPPQLSLKH